MKNSGLVLGLLLTVAVLLFLFGGRLREGLTTTGMVLLTPADLETAGFTPTGSFAPPVAPTNSSDPTSTLASKTKPNWSSNLKQTYTKLSGLFSTPPSAESGSQTGDAVLDLLIFIVYPYQSTYTSLSTAPSQSDFVSGLGIQSQPTNVQTALYQYFFGSAAPATPSATLTPTAAKKTAPSTQTTPPTQTCMPSVKQVPGGVSITQCFS